MPYEFKRLMFSRFFFTFAVQMQAVVLGWRMYELTQDALYLGLIGLAEAIPAIGLALYAGHLVDRGRPLVIYRRITGLSFLSAFLLCMTQLNIFTFSHEQQITLLFCSSFLTGLARSFSQPCMYALVPRLIPRALLPISSAWMSSAMQTARMSGPALGGLFFGFFGGGFTSLIILGCLIITILSLWTLSIPNSIQPENRTSPGANDFFLGFKYVLTHPILFPAMTLDMVAVLFGGVTALLPIFAAEILHTGAQGLGLLRAAPAMGAFLMSFWLMKNKKSTHSGHKLLWSVAGFGVCILIFSLSTNYFLSLLALGFSGAFDSISMVIRTTAVQLSSPEHLRGRISAVNSIFIGSSNELGEVESGIAAKLLGPVTASLFGGVMCLLTVVLVSMKFPRLRQMDTHDLKPH
jgi:MFS family permease